MDSLGRKYLHGHHNGQRRHPASGQLGHDRHARKRPSREQRDARLQAVGRHHSLDRDQRFWRLRAGWLWRAHLRHRPALHGADKRAGRHTLARRGGVACVVDGRHGVARCHVLRCRRRRRRLRRALGSDHGRRRHGGWRDVGRRGSHGIARHEPRHARHHRCGDSWVGRQLHLADALSDRRGGGR